MESSIFQLFERLANHGPSNLAAIDCIEGPRELPGELNYCQLHEYAKQVAGSLKQLGLGPSTTLASALRRGNDFYVLFLSCTYCRIPFVALSTDLPNKEAEQHRNQQIFLELKPTLLVLHDADKDRPFLGVEGCLLRTFSSLLDTDGTRLAFGSHAAYTFGDIPQSDETMCFQYTGGTTGASRCCRATQQMALWEVAKYKEVVELFSGDRVLQQHSAYWAASLFGEFDIAWAGHCALIFASCVEVSELTECITQHQVTCAGLVPSVLETLEDKELKSLRVVFTWGEALKSRTALSWAKRVHLIDLLIASEYWLCLYADWTKFHRAGMTGDRTRPSFKEVSDVKIHLEGDEEMKGEMLLSGPFVSPGYTNKQRSTEVFVDDALGTRRYRTRDCLARLSDGYQFAGRADDMVKVGGVWLDTREVVESLHNIQGVKHAYMYNKAAFAVVECCEAIPLIRRQLPTGYALFLVPSFPRTPTGKVDRKGLEALVGKGYTEKAQELEVEEQRKHLQLVARWYACLWPLLVRPLWDLSTAEEGSNFFVSFLWCCVNLLMRTILLGYLFLGLVYDTRWPWPGRDWPGFKSLKPYLRYFPGDYVMALVCFAGFVPLCLLVFAALPGVRWGLHRQRLTSWPIVVLVCFPRWSRDCGLWWYRASWKDIGGWYQASAKKNWEDQRRWWQEKLGYTRTCHHCKRQCLNGKVDTSDSNKPWYCEKCWSYYHRHWQCHKCRGWRTGAGEWVGNQWNCQKCVEAKKTAPSGEVNSLSAPLLAEVEAPPVKRLKTETTKETALQVDMRQMAQAQGQAQSHAADAAAGKGLLLGTPRGLGVELRQMVIFFRNDVTMVPSESNTSTASTAAVAKNPEWLEVEEGLGNWSFESLEDQLLGIDSLRFVKLTHFLSRKGKQLPGSAHRRCRTLRDLLQEIQPSALVPGNCQDMGQEWPSWGMMWGSLCGWRLHCRRALDRSALRRALEELMWRHVALRCDMADQMELFTQIQGGLSMLHLWRLCPGFASVRPIVCWALKSAWPRVRARAPQVDEVFKVLAEAETLEQADANLTTNSRKERFVPPFQLRVAPYRDGFVLQVRVTHMFSDAFCIIPLMADLAKLVKDQEEGLPSCLPPLPPSFELLQRRLWRTVEGDTTLSDTVTPTFFDSPQWSDEVHSEILNVPSGLVDQVKKAALKLAVSDEILLLSALGISIGKMHNKAAQTLHVLAPQRDDAAASDLIGLFVDHRRLEVPIQGLQYAGVALALHLTVKDRQWRAPPVVGGGNAPFVNFMWTDFEAHHGFEPIPTQKGKETSAAAPIQIGIVQPDRECWRILCTFKKSYTEDQVNRFYATLSEAVRCLIEDPFARCDDSSL